MKKSAHCLALLSKNAELEQPIILLEHLLNEFQPLSRTQPFLLIRGPRYYTLLKELVGILKTQPQNWEILFAKTLRYPPLALKKLRLIEKDCLAISKHSFIVHNRFPIKMMKYLSLPYKGR